MLISYNWLQTYFEDQLPSPDKLAELFTFHFSEVESVEKIKDDSVFDLKILPDRACYALSHSGVAYELAAILDLHKAKRKRIDAVCGIKEIIKVKNTEPALCTRYIARLVENVSVKNSPNDISKSLEAVGSRSINNIVDATNFVMFDLGQPLHAFDADKIKGSITIRKAKNGEKIILLDGREIALDESMLVIADDESALAIAGIKGGKKAEVTLDTKRIILEAANFDAVSVRKTSTKIAIRNDSSKRFENSLTPYLAKEAMEEVCALISKLSPQAKFGDLSDVYENLPEPKTIELSRNFVSKSLGLEISVPETKSILARLLIDCDDLGESYIVKVPNFRLDLSLPQDIVEEIGRIYGYDKIKAILPPSFDQKVVINKTIYWSEKIKDILVELGFSEVYTYTLTDKGETEIQNPLASDKNFLRQTLLDGLGQSLELNVKNADLLNLDQIKIFEIGTVFEVGDEHLSLAVGVLNVKGRKTSKENEALTQAIRSIEQELGVSFDLKQESVKNVFEINLTKIIEKLPEPQTWNIVKPQESKICYQPISAYPFIVRDVAVFVPSEVSENEVAEIIAKNAGPLKVRQDLFDVFTKKIENGEEKTSYAFRLVFQSSERTLREEDANEAMGKVYKALSLQKNWQVR